jgi:hypothetical protein
MARRALEATENQRPAWHALVVLLLVCGLTVSIATKTVHVVPSFTKAFSAPFHSPQAKRQPLEIAELEWTPPVSEVIAFFEASSFYPRVSPAGPPVAGLVLAESLFNRPPPSC